jgi:uncharacterized membrane protein YbaN (DUF454 family)
MLSKILFLIAGYLCLVLGFIGAFLPILPTTPFVLLAAYCFSKGSDRMYNSLLQTKLFGPLIIDWRAHGVIPMKAKILSTTMIVLLFSYTLIFVPVAVWIKIIVATSGMGVLAFIWSRPSYPKN